MIQTKSFQEKIATAKIFPLKKFPLNLNEYCKILAVMMKQQANQILKC